MVKIQRNRDSNKITPLNFYNEIHSFSLYFCESQDFLELVQKGSRPSLKNRNLAKATLKLLKIQQVARFSAKLWSIFQSLSCKIFFKIRQIYRKFEEITQTFEEVFAILANRRIFTKELRTDDLFPVNYQPNLGFLFTVSKNKFIFDKFSANLVEVKSFFSVAQWYRA